MNSRLRGLALAVCAVAVLGGGAVALADANAVWWAPGAARTFPAVLDYPDPTGVVRTLNTSGPVATRDHPFFAPLGPNGRACVSCHQPADAMSLSTASIQARWEATGGKDPIFAAVDGANCPTAPQDRRASHSLLLERGLFRIARPWPPRDAEGQVVTPEISIRVVRDPTGCNTGPAYGLTAANPTISVYRRPRPLTNLKYLLAVGFATDPKSGMPLPLDPKTGERLNGNLMADGRVRTLEDQAHDALAGHLEIGKRLSSGEVERIIRFASGLYTAQYADKQAGLLTDAGAKGGPELLKTATPGVLAAANAGIWSEFAAWDRPDNGGATPEQRAFRQSVARGAKLFKNRTFIITDSAGINSGPGFGNPVRNGCAFCHNMQQMGNDLAPGQVDLGTTNEPFADPAPDLPLFEVTCLKRPHPHLGRVIYTQDPGYALTTGKCADVGKITLQSLRGLAARAPFFSNGSAKTLREVIDFYDRRYNIHFTEDEKTDLINLMSVL